MAKAKALSDHTLYSLQWLPLVQVGKSTPSRVLSSIELLEKTSLMTYGPIHDVLNLVGYSTMPALCIIAHMSSNNFRFHGHLSNTTFLRLWVASKC
jgi:hypothetical protein